MIYIYDIFITTLLWGSRPRPHVRWRGSPPGCESAGEKTQEGVVPQVEFTRQVGDCKTATLGFMV